MDTLKSSIQTDDEFSYDQNVLRSKIRLKEGRFTPLDIVLYSISLLDTKKRNLMEEKLPNFVIKDVSYQILDKLGVTELLEMLREIDLYSLFDSNRRDFWEALKILCQNRIRILNNDDPVSTIHPDIMSELKEEFQKMNSKKLASLENEIKTNLDSKQNLDVEFFDQVQRMIEIFRSKALLDEYHSKILSEFEKIKEENMEEKIARRNEDDEVMREMIRRASEHTQVGDYDFFDECDLSTTTTSGNSKKPKYSNKAMYGIDFSKYQTDKYDKSAPPRKFVQGYKFHIFYPDLIDASVTPNFRLENPDKLAATCTLIFHAGAPYQDIGFTIVNKEWEKNHRFGYNATFERGILLLHFEFKRGKLY
jgi:hypothetical protein